MGNRVCEALGIKYPVIQGPMAWTSLPPLVAAVSNAGGLGVLGSGAMPGDIIKQMAEGIRAMTDKPFGANIFLDPGPILDEACDAIIEAKFPVVYIDTLALLEESVAMEYYGKFKAAGLKIVAKINYLSDAIVAAKCGADVIIAKGVEGGGHCTRISGRVLLAECVENIPDTPIVASGGIATPRQAAGCTVVGADGIEMGTAFMTTIECPTHPNVKQAIVNAIDRDVVACGQSTGEPSWQLRNALADEMLKAEADLPWSEAAEFIRKESMGSLRAASLEGEVKERGAVLSGQVCGLIHDIVPVKALVEDFCEEWQEWLKKEYTLI